MPRKLITAPAVEPLSTAEAKDHLHVDDANSDTLIDRQVVAARQLCESKLSRALITQTWDVFFDAFPAEIILPLPTLQSVVSIKHTDNNGTVQTLASSEYVVDSNSIPGLVRLDFNKTWPATRNIANAVVVQFKAGYGDAGSDVPEIVRQAMELMIGHWFEHREAVVLGSLPQEISLAVDDLLATERVWYF